MFAFLQQNNSIIITFNANHTKKQRDFIVEKGGWFGMFFSYY